MRLVTLFLIAAFAASTVGAGSYQKRDGTIVDPILKNNDDPHPYSGEKLEPYADLSAAKLHSANLTNANLNRANLTDADLSNANLTDAYLYRANLTGADLSNANLSDADLIFANLTGATLYDSDLNGAHLIHANLSDANLKGSNISEAQIRSAVSLTGVNFSGHDMSGWDLSDLDFTGATLTGVNLSGAVLPAALPSLPVIKGAVVNVLDTLAVLGSVQVDTGGNLSVNSDSFTATGVNMQGGSVHGSLFGLDLDEIGDVSGHGRLFGDVDLGTSGAIAGSGTGLELFGHVSGSGNITGSTVYGNLVIGTSPGTITLEDSILSGATTTVFEVGGTDVANFDQLLLAGSVALNGSAEISFTDGFAPQESDTFQLVDLGTATLTNWFQQVTAPDGWGVSETGQLYNLQYAATPVLGGDFNSDGVIDAADFTVWQDNLGLSASALNGNGSGAATVVQADYLLWKTNFEALATGSEGTAAVPEPATLLLAFLAMTAVPLRVRCG